LAGGLATLSVRKATLSHSRARHQRLFLDPEPLSDLTRRHDALGEISPEACNPHREYRLHRPHVYHGRVAALRVTGLVKRYGGKTVVDALDLHVEPGEVVGLLGPNGAGKTTTLDCILGLVEPDAGEIEVLGHPQPRERDAMRERVGVALQETRLHDKLTVRETLELFRSFYSDGLEETQLLGELDLQPHAGQLVGALSGGQRQRLGLACALIGDPDLLVLDEPSTGLDPGARHRLWDQIEGFSRGAQSVLLTTHFMEEADRLCDRLVVMNAGQIIAEDTPLALTKTHVGSDVIELELVRGSLPMDVIEALGSVRVALLVGSTLRAGTDDPATAMDELQRAAAAHDVVLGRRARGPATLDDVFLVLSGGSLGAS